MLLDSYIFDFFLFLGEDCDYLAMKSSRPQNMMLKQ